MTPYVSPERRFWPRVNKDGPLMPGMSTPCHVWTGGTNSEGYGYFWVNGKNVRVTRWVWEQRHGPIPDGQTVLHRCDNPPCVRHFYLGTHQRNMEDMRQRNRQARPRGEANNNAKLTEEVVQRIRGRYVRGAISLKKVASEFGISEASVSLIVRRKIWNHVEEKTNG